MAPVTPVAPGVGAGGTGAGTGAGAGAAGAATVWVIVVGGGVVAVSLRSRRATPKPIAAIESRTAKSSASVAPRQRGVGAILVRAAAPHDRHQF
ncbi:MAG: hypothetical protein NVSMB51_14450 [Solirubrobacteraceae bacterium]